MSEEFEELEIRGSAVRVPFVTLNKVKIIRTGTYLKTASVRYEWKHDIDDPEFFLSGLRKSGLNADVFLFQQRLPDADVRYKYQMEWYDVAALPITDYTHWWAKEASQECRNKIRKSRKKGVEVREASYDDEYIRGILEIYNETPVRQGKPFWHYNKDFETIKKIHGSFPDDSIFVGAFLDGTMIGFLKLVQTDRFTRTMHILSKNEHRDKSPTNALIAKAVEICCNRKIPYLVYGQYDYGRTAGNSLTTFKRDNGFKKVLLPRYYVPLSLKGQLALKLNLHKGVANVLPGKVLMKFLDVRKRYYSIRRESTIWARS